MTSTLAGGTRPAAVIWPVKKRSKCCAASTTALQGRGERRLGFRQGGASQLGNTSSAAPRAC